MNLYEFLDKYAHRGECMCGKCADAVADPEQKQPEGHTADMIFFKVSAQNQADPVRLREAIAAHKGEFDEVDLFDGNEHNYLEIGGFVGDQGYALTLMGLGSALGLWRLLTPRTMLGGLLPEEAVMEMAGLGMVAIQADKNVGR